MSSPQPHAVCVPFPAQGHINPMLNVAKLLHAHGFHITFVLTEFNHRRLIRSSGQEAVKGLPDFQFETIPDGLPFSDMDATQNPPTLCHSTSKNCLPHFRLLLAELNIDNTGRRPPISCIIADVIMSFTLDAAHELSIPEVLLWTASASGCLAYKYYYHQHIDRALSHHKDSKVSWDEFLDMEVNWAPGLMKGISLRDFPSFIHTMDANDIMVNFIDHETSRASQASAIIFNTFEDLELSAIIALKNMFHSPIYSIGPLSLLTRNKISNKSPLATINLNLWKQDDSCLYWLNSRTPCSVVYVNFGAVIVMSKEQVVEIAWGLANSGYDFLWVIRPDFVKCESFILPSEFLEVIKERGLIVSWCVQEEVLMHPAVGIFLTHTGWNSTIESISSGVPMICSPFFAEQPINCKYTCEEWGIGIKIDNNMKREKVEALIKEMMGGEQSGKEMRKKALEWKEIAVKASGPNGASEVNFDMMVKDVLLGTKVIN